MVAIPTLAAGEPLAECLFALETQSGVDFSVIVVDNSGCGRARPFHRPPHVRVLECASNAGFGAAANMAIRESSSRHVCVINDDTVPRPGFLNRLLSAAEERPEIGMCAPKILLSPGNTIDSAGMLLSADGSSKQNAHGLPADSHNIPGEAFFPSGCAALYRREMLDEIGLFDESYFLYCEDTDLGLRGRWAAWECRYVPDAIIEHRYSATAGSASPLKAFYVERNRLCTAVKNLPFRGLVGLPFFSLVRYFWHGIAILRRRGRSGDFIASGGTPLSLAGVVLKAHVSAAMRLPELIRARRTVKRRLSPRQFEGMCRHFRISLREVGMQ